MINKLIQRFWEHLDEKVADCRKKMADQPDATKSDYNGYHTKAAYHPLYQTHNYQSTYPPFFHHENPHHHHHHSQPQDTFFYPFSTFNNYIFYQSFNCQGSHNNRPNNNFNDENTQSMNLDVQNASHNINNNHQTNNNDNNNSYLQQLSSNNDNFNNTTWQAKCCDDSYNTHSANQNTIQNNENYWKNCSLKYTISNLVSPFGSMPFSYSYNQQKQGFTDNHAFHNNIDNMVDNNNIKNIGTRVSHGEKISPDVATTFATTNNTIVSNIEQDKNLISCEENIYTNDVSSEDCLTKVSDNRHSDNKMLKNVAYKPVSSNIVDKNMNTNNEGLSCKYVNYSKEEFCNKNLPKMNENVQKSNDASSNNIKHNSTDKKASETDKFNKSFISTDKNTTGVMKASH